MSIQSQLEGVFLNLKLWMKPLITNDNHWRNQFMFDKIRLSLSTQDSQWLNQFTIGNQWPSLTTQVAKLCKINPRNNQEEKKLLVPILKIYKILMMS